LTKIIIDFVFDAAKAIKNPIEANRKTANVTIN
jgi:hypothetical protein